MYEGRTIHVFDDPAELSRSAAQLIEEAAHSAAEERGRFTFVLSGGSTPRRLFQELAGRYSRRIPWQYTHVFWSDERCVPPDHPDSNFALAEATLLPYVHIPPSQIYRVPTEFSSHETSAHEYEMTLRRQFPGEDAPSFDVVQLGLGTDGHTASLFPVHVPEGDRWVEAVVGPPDRPPTHRVTMTFQALNGARAIIFLVTGAEKHRALRAVLDEPESHPELPATRIHPRSRVEWLVDRVAYEGA